MKAEFLLTILMLSLCGIAIPGTAHAYIDPGSGSIVLQMILAGIAGGVFYFRSALARFLGLFKQSDERKSGD